MGWRKNSSCGTCCGLELSSADGEIFAGVFGSGDVVNVVLGFQALECRADIATKSLFLCRIEARNPRHALILHAPTAE